MSTVSGACLVNKISGMCYVREDVTPSILEWKAVELSDRVVIPLKDLVNLQATKESSPKMILKVIYKENDTEKDIKISFTNRPTMNNIKESLQTIVSRQRTVVKDSKSATPGAASSDDLNISSVDGLSDAKLLKNHQLQQKLLLEDKELRNLFTQSVINYKLSPNIFWSTRLNLLRTYALTISQHRGRYNVLSTIKPVATSDNQVNVNVTRTVINEIFDTYPIVKKAFDELVPAKFQEGEFWSRFFNSKLFRRLRGDKINNSNERGDLVLDKYLYIDDKTQSPQDPDEVNKFIDLRGNELDNSVKMGNKPDFTMKFENDKSDEMIILMQNMNKLSSKMIPQENQVEPTIQEYEEELNLHDLNPSTDSKYVDLHINTDLVEVTVDEVFDTQQLKDYLSTQIILRSAHGINLTDASRTADINESYNDINNLVKLNHRTFRIINNQHKSSESLLTPQLVEEFLTINLTTNEFLSHFWKIFLNEGSPVQLKKLFVSLKTCKKKILELRDQAIEQISSKSTDKVKDKNINDLNFILSPITIALDKAFGDYISAVKALSEEVNENGKRPLDDTSS